MNVLLIAAVLLALAACQREAGKPAAQMSAEGAPSAGSAASMFAQAEQAWRDQRRERLLAPDGWTSLVGLHWIDPGSHYLGSAADNGIRLAMGPAHLGMIEIKGERIRFVPDKDAPLTLDEQPLAGATNLKTDMDENGPSVIGFDEGKGEATVIKRGDRFALRVKHADAPTRTGFTGLDYWPVDAGWKVQGKYVAHEPGRTMDVASIIGTIEPADNPGLVEFQRDGQTYRIEAIDEGDGRLFLVFADRTNGHGSYGAGRFLYAEKPDASGKVVIDFNQSYNPPCAFTAFATCPLPPPENRLDVAITAGEKAYNKPHEG
jgi:uncharacterized protein (DUF1684 family)